VRSWVAGNKPALPDFVLPQSFLEVANDRQFHYLRDWQAKLYAAGLLGFEVPQAYGGRGTGSPLDGKKSAIVSQELGVARTPFLVNLIGLQWAGPTIMTYGTEAQKQRYLGPILSAEEIWCQGFSEPEFGSDLASLQTRAVRSPDGGWRVTGHKVWTTLAHVSTWMILLARTRAEGNKYEGLSYFLFPMQAPGVTIQPLVKMTGEGGFNQVIFDDAPMPDEALLGVLHQGWKVAMTTLLFERGAADASGRERSAQDAAALARLVALAKMVRRDGAPAADDPILRDRLATLWIELEGLRRNAQRAAIPALCMDHPGALAFSHKLVFSEWMQRLALTACDVLGTEAALWMGDPEAPDGGEWPRAYMNSYGFTIGGGTSEIQRNILGERVLGLSKSK
jgi:alkylation response protein AidB-like acyl-CoA dehydrogenase